MNIDLCFVPASHATVEKLPAVSGSSGRLVIETLAEPEQTRSWPGQVFGDENLDYGEAMTAFATASLEQGSRGNSASTAETDKTSKAQKQVLRQQEEQLRSQRRTERQRRHLEDTAWQALKQARPTPATGSSAPSSSEQTAQKAQWCDLRQQRREQMAQRQADDREWQQQCQALRQRWSQLPIVTAWIAILAITDNCTRQGLGLPLFVAGSHVTAEMIVEALRRLLPPALRFLISDRGVHVRADAFRTLVRSEDFIHVLIARHRPQSNGIAERFVRSLKEWLRDKSWQDDQQLAALLTQFLAEYNDRPHQGLAIPGLSPNQFARRIWLL